MSAIAILIFLVTAAALGGGAALTLRLIELNRGVPMIGDGTELLGRRATVARAIKDGSGWVVVDNHRWRAMLARGESRVEAGAAVRIVERLGGLVLVVEPLDVRVAEVVALPTRNRPAGERKAA